MSVSDKGKVVEFVMDGRYAAGTGRFFGGMARVLDCGLEGLSLLSLQAKAPATISS